MTRRMRTIVEEKVYDIKSGFTMVGGMGDYWEIPGIVWAEGNTYISEEECEKHLVEVKEDWKERLAKNPWGTTSKEPKLTVYWITRHEEVTEIKMENRG